MKKRFHCTVGINGNVRDGLLAQRVIVARPLARRHADDADKELHFVVDDLAEDPDQCEYRQRYRLNPWFIIFSSSILITFTLNMVIVFFSFWQICKQYGLTSILRYEVGVRQFCLANRRKLVLACTHTRLFVLSSFDSFLDFFDSLLLFFSTLVCLLVKSVTVY